MNLLKGKRIWRFIAWSGFTVTLVLILAGLFFGRRLQRNFPNIEFNLFWIHYLLAAGAFLATAVLLYRCWHSNPIHLRRFFTLLMASLAIIFLFLFLVNSTLTLAIEEVHFIKYSSLAFWLSSLLGARRFGLKLTVSLGIALMDEYTQMILPNRYFDYHDIMLNFLGVFFGLCTEAMLQLWLRLWHQTSTSSYG